VLSGFDGSASANLSFPALAKEEATADRSPRTEYGEMLLNDALGRRSANGVINPEDWISPDPLV
jgi:hypothetical protein